jgi:hypothetical protein
MATARDRCILITPIASVLDRMRAAAMGDVGLLDVAMIDAGPCPEGYLLPFFFEFNDSRTDRLRDYVGLFAFAGPASARVLLVPDFEGYSVHAIDVVSRERVGYVIAPGTVQGPRAVAAHGRLAAVIIGPSWEQPTVHVFEGEGGDWTPLWVIGAGIVKVCNGPGEDDDWSRPGGLCFTSDGTGLAVVSGSLSLFSMVDGAFVRHIAEDLGNYTGQVEQSDDGWLVGHHGRNTVVAIGNSSPESRQWRWPCPGFALARELGLLFGVHAESRRVLVHATPEAVAMAVMSPARVAWLGAVARAVRRPRP